MINLTKIKTRLRSRFCPDEGVATTANNDEVVLCKMDELDSFIDEQIKELVESLPRARKICIRCGESKGSGEPCNAWGKSYKQHSYGVVYEDATRLDKELQQWAKSVLK